MAFAVRRDFVSSAEPQPSVSSGRQPVCRVHACVRCAAAIDSFEPCTFSPIVLSVCSACRGQEHALAHLSRARGTWGARLAQVRRA